MIMEKENQWKKRIKEKEKIREISPYSSGLRTCESPYFLGSKNPTALGLIAF
ncbi:hypothetical protein [Methanosarcina barkeri]|uniref:hypothetical protein n=1 Tax=Methanosarcina barkeri TaxID=2208 RepID=UPI0012D372BE|nr:hypothetical protein [Methanosarcina barkeri]